MYQLSVFKDYLSFQSFDLNAFWLRQCVILSELADDCATGFKNEKLHLKFQTPSPINHMPTNDIKNVVTTV